MRNFMQRMCMCVWVGVWVHVCLDFEPVRLQLQFAEQVSHSKPPTLIGQQRSTVRARCKLIESAWNSVFCLTTVRTWGNPHCGGHMQHKWLPNSLEEANSQRLAKTVACGPQCTLPLRPTPCNYWLHAHTGSSFHYDCHMQLHELETVCHYGTERNSSLPVDFWMHLDFESP